MAELDDVVYTAIGFAVLAFQRTQVARREIERELASIGRSVSSHVREAATFED
ncbi:MAG: hypothetical protein GXP35_17595 [Actinobacteria bacterium]|nr:hypothetical protein [Actinomycetota bacterium]